MKAYNSIIIPLYFNEPKGIDLPENQPLPFQQFPSARTVQNSNCGLFLFLQAVKSKLTAQDIVGEDGNMGTVKLFRISINNRKV